MAIKQNRLKFKSKLNEGDVTAFFPAASTTIASRSVAYRSGNKGNYPELTPADGNVIASLGKQLWWCSLGADNPSGLAPQGKAHRRVNVSGVNTFGSSIGAPVYLSDTAGGWSLTAGTYKVVLGFVTKVSSADGVLDGEFEFDPAPVNIISGTATIAATATTVVVPITSGPLFNKPAFASVVAELPLAAPPVADSALLYITRCFWHTDGLNIEGNAAANDAQGVLVNWAIIA